jgi:hypothetical protein
MSRSGSAENLDFLDGIELQQIILQSCQLTFEFDKDIKISVEQDWELFFKDQKIGHGDPQKQSGPIVELQKLIGTKIIKVLPKQSGELSLLFSNEYKLTLFRPENKFEAYNITGKDLYLVVF